ncbi:MAG: hypothetical protein ABIS35_09540, partial [Terracoccus sp.]
CCDEVATLLALAGWADLHAEAVRTRDAFLTDPQQAASRLAHLDRRLRRSRLLRWSLRGLGVVTDDAAKELPPRLTGDAHARLLAQLDRARDAADADFAEEPTGDLPALAARLVVGLDLAAARLVVASLAVRTDVVGAEAVEVSRA